MLRYHDIEHGYKYEIGAYICNTGANVEVASQPVSKKWRAVFDGDGEWGRNEEGAVYKLRAKRKNEMNECAVGRRVTPPLWKADE